jgi:hypothetical protein
MAPVSETKGVATKRLVVGSNNVLATWCSANPPVSLQAGADVVVLPTGAAFLDPAKSAIEIARVLEPHEYRVEALMVLDRGAANEEYFAERVQRADAVVLSDGAALHLRTTYRDTALYGAVASASLLVTIGGASTVFGATMIDPRGGAPTTGLGDRHGLVVTTPSSEEQLHRTRELLGTNELLAVLDDEGALYFDGDGWRQLSDTGVTLTRGTTSATF